MNYITVTQPNGLKVMVRRDQIVIIEEGFITHSSVKISRLVTSMATVLCLETVDEIEKLFYTIKRD